MLRLFWQRQGVACPPASLPYVREVAAANGVMLPPDFEQLYCAVNGTPELHKLEGLYFIAEVSGNPELGPDPENVDENFCFFLPVEALRPEYKEWILLEAGVATREQTGVIFFVDFLHHCWDYGFIADTNGAGYRIGIMPTHGVFEGLTTSLTEFLQWYVEDAEALYDVDYTFEPPP